MLFRSTPTSGYVRAAVASTSDIMDQHAEVFPETIPEVLPLLRKINHKIRFKPGAEQKTLPTYSIPERYVSELNELIRDKERKGMIRREHIQGAALMFVQAKKDGKRI